MRHHLASLTSRLVLTTVALVLLVSVLIGTVTTFAVRSSLTDQLDDGVRAALARGARMVAGPPGDRGADGPGPRPDDPSQGVGTLAARWPAEDPAGAAGVVTTQRSDGRFSSDTLPQEALGQIDELAADGRPQTLDLEGLGTYRVAVTDDGVGGRVAAGLSTQNVDDAVTGLVRWEVVLTMLALTVGGGVALVVVRRQLRTLREVAATAHTVSELPLSEGDIDLAERVPAHLTDERTEVGQVGAALNTLLAHVESSLAARHRSEQQVRQFVADASHELRSPLATISGYTELARRRPDDREALDVALRKVEAEAGRMSTLVEDLLLLARLDAGRPLERAPVDLTRLMLEAASDARVVAPGHHWRVDVPDDAVDSPYVVLGDEPRLHQVVTNLLTNARTHTPVGTTVTLTVRRGGFEVCDDGPGFPPGLAHHAFERFARGDAARTRDAQSGTGLGLALVDAIVSAHGGSTSLSSRPGETRISVSLPG